VSECGTEALEDAEHLLEQRGRAELWIFFRRDAVQLGHQRGKVVSRRTDHGVERGRIEPAMQCAQRLDDRAEGKRAVDDLDAASRKNQ